MTTGVRRQSTLLPGCAMEVTKFRSQLLIALEQVTVQLHDRQNTLTGLVRRVVRTSETERRKLLARLFHATVVANDKITNQLSAAVRQVTLRLQRGQDALTGLAKTVADKPRRLQEAVHAREGQLRKSLASSFDAVVVTNADRSLVSANPIALRLLGVSGANLGRFTLDAFLPHGQLPYLDAKGSHLIGREERRGQCKIRRLDGRIRVAEYVFVPNFVPFRHLCRFRKDREWPPNECPPRKKLDADRKNRHWPI